VDGEPRVVIFACGWNAYESLQVAGTQRLHYPPGARFLKVDCLGQIGASVILKAFEKGADGVMLIGCTPEECHYEFGSRHASELFEEVRQVANLLGLEDRLKFLQVPAGAADTVTHAVRVFVSQIAAEGAAQIASR
jgi:coenzyme F420-reducing hydrogenase delta subunit